MEHMDALMKASQSVPWCAVSGETFYSAPAALSIEVAEETDGEVPVVGVALPFDTPDGIGRVIKSGAFDESLKASKGRLPILLEHDPRLQIGIGTSATVVDGTLRVAGVLLPTIPAARDQLVIMRAAARRGMTLSISIGWRGNFEMQDNLFIWKKAELVEWSIVRFPAFADTKVEEASDTPRTAAIIYELAALKSALTGGTQSQWTNKRSLNRSRT